MLTETERKARRSAYMKQYRVEGPRPRLAGPILLETTELELAWAAGLFEGEGAISIVARSSQNRSFLQVQISNTDRTICEFFHVRWGGSLYSGQSEGNRRRYYRWGIAAKKAAVFLVAIQPYLRTTKYRSKVDLGLKFQAQKGPPGRPLAGHPEYVEAQQAFYREMRHLNALGRGGQVDPKPCQDKPEKSGKRR